MPLASAVIGSTLVLCAEFGLFPVDTPLGPSFQLPGFTFQNHSHSPSVVKEELGEKYLRFDNAGISISLARPSNDVNMRIAVFGSPIGVQTKNNAGTVLSYQTVSAHGYSNIQVSEKGIAEIELRGGNNEGGLQNICFAIPTPAFTDSLLDHQDEIAEKSQGEAIFSFVQWSPAGELKEFFFKLKDKNQIAEARRLLASKYKTHVAGIINPIEAKYNPEWSFQMKPETVNFFLGVYIEVCDANVTYVEQHIDEVGGSFLPGGQWCPWSSQLAREIK